MRVRAHRDAKRARQTKIGQFELEGLLVDEEVLRLEVAVEDAPVVAEAHAREQLEEQCLDGLCVERLRLCVEVLFEVEVKVLEDEGELLLGVDDVVQAHDIRVLQLLEDGDLADRRRWDALVLRLEPDLL